MDESNTTPLLTKLRQVLAKKKASEEKQAETLQQIASKLTGIFKSDLTTAERQIVDILVADRILFYKEFNDTEFTVELRK